MASTSTSIPLPLVVPPLENGDSSAKTFHECLIRLECERHYYAMPRITKAELIEGMVYMPSFLQVSDSP